MDSFVGVSEDGVSSMKEDLLFFVVEWTGMLIGNWGGCRSTGKDKVTYINLSEQKEEFICPKRICPVSLQ